MQLDVEGIGALGQIFSTRKEWFLPYRRVSSQSSSAPNLSRDSISTQDSELPQNWARNVLHHHHRLALRKMARLDDLRVQGACGEVLQTLWPSPECSEIMKDPLGDCRETPDSIWLEGCTRPGPTIRPATCTRMASTVKPELGSAQRRKRW